MEYNKNWWKFPKLVACLQRRLTIWKRKSHNGTLSEPENLENKEVAFLSKCCPSWGRTPISVPVIEGSIIDIEGLLESINGQPSRLHIISDLSFEPLKDSEDEIYHALDTVDGPAVVLLHGGAGKGKSIVARSSFLHYSEKWIPQFDHVFFLNCGPQVKISDIQFELIQRLGSQPFASLQDNKYTRSVPIPQQLKRLLAERKVLLILEDVSDEEFLREIVELCGRGVKCLVTSQLGSVCGNLDRSKFVSMEIQDVDQDIATKILRCHLEPYGRPYPIQPHLQEMANRMICETEFNPLALASLASVINQKQSDLIQGRGPDELKSQQMKDWEAASMTFFRALESEVPAEFFNGKYPRSLWATTGVNISTLNTDARNLLLLTHAFEGPSIPEEVVRVVFSSMKLEEKYMAFSRSAIELESRKLININEDLGGQRSWKVHSFQKRYIEEEMRDARDSIFASLAVDGSTVSEGDNNGAKTGYGSTARRFENVTNSDRAGDAVVTTLCALYLDKHVAWKAAAKMGFPLEHFSKQKRNAIEPVTRLLALALGKRWTATARDCATKVFLSYICNGELEDSSISELLRNSTGAIAMCEALRHMAVIEEKTFMSDKSSRELMKALVNNMSDIREESIRKTALETIAKLTQNEENDLFIVSFPEALDRIGRCLKNIHKVSYYDSDTFEDTFEATEARHSIWTESAYDGPTLTYEGTSGMRMRQTAARVVTSSLTMEPELQDFAAYTLSKLAFGADEIKIKIARQPGLLEGLARLLRQEGRTSGIAAHTLMTLALAENDNIRVRVKETAAHIGESVIDGLISLVQSAPSILTLYGSSIFDFYWKEREYCAAVALTMFDPERGNKLTLLSGLAYGGRGHANFAMGSVKEALEGLVKAHEMEPEHAAILRDLRTLRAKMGDLHEALALADTAIFQGLEDAEFDWQERGIIKRMLGDLHGALEDLNRGLELKSDDYEILKHRGHVKFMLGDAIGAKEDGDRALNIQPPSVNHTQYGNFSDCLGANSVQYMGLHLK